MILLHMQGWEIDRERLREEISNPETTSQEQQREEISNPETTSQEQQSEHWQKYLKQVLVYIFEWGDSGKFKMPSIQGLKQFR